VDRDKIATLIEDSIKNASSHNSPVHKHNNCNTSMPESLSSAESRMVSFFLYIESKDEFS